MRQPGRNAAKPTANGLDGKSKNGHGERSQHDSNDRAWDRFSESWEQQNDQERTDANQFINKVKLTIPSGSIILERLPALGSSSS